jgi:lysophospholipase L1-like esterase
MPLGDSITLGFNSSPIYELNNGYRKHLYTLLTSDGFNIDFVGDINHGDFEDTDHQGWDGWRTDQIRDELSEHLLLNPPQVILLHTGTNDISQGEDPAGIISEVEQILDIIDEFNESVIVLLARIINRQPYSQATTDYNILLQSMAEARISNGDIIYVVDQESALNYIDDLDGNHPNVTGYDKMAERWLPSVIQAIFDYSLPVILSSFTAEKVNRHVKLTWTTESEINNLGFIVERFNRMAARYEILASYKTHMNLMGAGSSNYKIIYEFIDTDVESGNLYRYRLHEVNSGNNITLLDSVSILFDTIDNDNDFRISMYPNPFNDTIKIEYFLAEENSVKIQIFDISGRKISTLINGENQVGKNIIRWEGTDGGGNKFSSGVYILAFQFGDNSYYKQIILAR